MGRIILNGGGAGYGGGSSGGAVSSVNGKVGAVELTAGDVGAVPAPATAQVGQTIVVKAVDDAGRPTEWEAADMAAGGGDDYELIEKIIVGYSITTERPSVGWYAGETVVEQDLNASEFAPVEGTFYRHTGATNYLFPGNGIYYYNGTDYQSYYANTGTEREPVYSAVNAQEVWAAGTYYSYDADGGVVVRNREIDGKAYALKSVIVICQKSDKSQSIGTDLYFKEIDQNHRMNVPGEDWMELFSFVNVGDVYLKCNIYGKVMNHSYYMTGNYSFAKKTFYPGTTYVYQGEPIIEINVSARGINMMGNTEVYLYGVRA